jgi:hypothetical protein
MARELQGAGEVFCERYFQIFELLPEPLLLVRIRFDPLHHKSHLIQFILALFWIVDGRLVSVVKQMSRSDQPITPVIAWTASY